MERVGTLLQKLQEQYDRKAPADQLLLTVQQLNAELQHLQGAGSNNNGVAIVMPVMQGEMPVQEVEKAVGVTIAPVEEEKIVEVLQIDEAEVEAELEEIKRKHEEMQRMSMHSKPVVVYEQDAEDEVIPTFAHQEQKPKEVHEVIGEKHQSLNDKLNQGKMELGDHLVEIPIRDLKKAIGVNDRFLYITELFRGDEAMYERSIKTINGFSILAEAEYWMQRELKVKLGWDEKSETLQQFNQLIKRRFT
jgi:hypothetical protein